MQVQTQRCLVTVLAMIISVLTAYILVAHQFSYSRVVANLSDEHGLHLADIPVVGFWLVGMAICAMLWARPSAGVEAGVR